MIATPWGVVDRCSESLSDVLDDLIREKEIKKIIVGYPTPLKTDENERTRQVDEFIDHFIRDREIPFETVSERYSTKEATRLREERGETGEGSDAEAAAMILEYYLDLSRSFHSSESPEG